MLAISPFVAAIGMWETKTEHLQSPHSSSPPLSLSPPPTANPPQARGFLGTDLARVFGACCEAPFQKKGIDRISSTKLHPVTDKLIKLIILTCFVNGLLRLLKVKLVL